MGLWTNNSDGSFDYAPIDSGLLYFRCVDDLNDYILKTNNNK